MTRRDGRADALVVGSGPNGLAAAVVLARTGLEVLVLEAADHLGGGLATRELTLPGFRHDVCSAVHPGALTSPFFRAFGLEERVELRQAEIAYAHPLPGRPAAVAYRSLERTATELGELSDLDGDSGARGDTAPSSGGPRDDGAAWRALLGKLVDRPGALADLTSGSLWRLPRDVPGTATFAARVLETAGPWRAARFAGEAAPALLAGCVAHTVAHPASLAAAGAGLKLATEAHSVGWPVPVGGSQAIADAMVADIRAHGGRFATGHRVTSLAEATSLVRPGGAVLLDVSVPAFLGMAGGALPAPYRAALRSFRPGPGVAKVDVALAGPIPWRDPHVAAAPTVHLGGTWRQIHAAERAVQAGHHPAAPYVLLTQPSVVDATRAPGGAHVLWAYTHVPAGSDRDMLGPILARIEEHAPGVRDLVLAASSWSARDMARLHPNQIGGDIMGGALTARQLLARPVPGTAPWRTPIPGVYLASASTPPGPAVHGMCGYHAARLALANRFGVTALPNLAPWPPPTSASSPSSWPPSSPSSSPPSSWRPWRRA